MATKNIAPIIFSFLFTLLCYIPDAQSQCDYTEINITSITGNYGDEMSWELKDSNGTLIANFEGQNNDETSMIVVCLEDGCYSFIANDSYGDGWNGGTVQLSWGTNVLDFGLPGGNEQVFYFGINESDCIPEILGCTDPDAFNYDPMATVDDGSCLTAEGIAAQQVFDTICYSGSKDNRINWIIQNRSSANAGNNFTDAAELRSDLEETLIPAFTLNDPGAKTPYAQYKDFFNLYAVWWPDAPGDHTWWNFSIIQSLRDEIFLPWANDETGWVTWFSTTKYGGGGGAGLNRDARVGDGKMFGTGFETLLHEFGHTMPGLLDEYTSSGEWSGNQCWETPNTTGYTIKDSIPWRKWIADDTPLPTPYIGSNENVIGGFEGGLTNYFGCHRPTAKGCYMGAGGFGEGYGEDLCSPCMQRVICYLYKYVNVIENPTPSSPNLSVTGDQTVTFSAEVIAPEPNTQKYEWFLNGKLIAENTTTLEVTFGKCDSYDLKFAVTDTTDLVRYDEKFDDIYPKPYRELVWTIDQTDVSSYGLSSSATTAFADCTGLDNGEVTLLANGGEGPYEYWLTGTQVSNPATGLAPGVHNFIVVDANGCAVEQEILVDQEAFLDIEVCSSYDGGWNVTLAYANYDIDNLDILWSTGNTEPSISGVSDGNYSVTATVNGCSVTENFSLTTAASDIAVSHSFFPSEMGSPTGTIYVDVEGGTSAYQIQWFDRLMADRTDSNLDNISASGTTWGHLPEMAFDNNLNTKWLHAVNSDAWVGYEFSEATTIAFYVITSADDVPERDPKDWRLEGSNDGDNWTVLDTRTDEDFPSRYQKRTFPITTPQAFKYCRLFVENSAGENQIQLQELEFIGTDPTAPFLYNPEFDGKFSRTELAPGDYHYEIADASSACVDGDISIATYEAFLEDGLIIIQYNNCGVSVENPQAAKDYYWLSDENGTELLGQGIIFEPPHSGNFYVTSGPVGSGQWSSNRKGFAVTMPEIPQVEMFDEGTLAIVNPKPDEEYLWYDVDNCGTPVTIGNSFSPGMEANQFYVAARSTIEYPEPIDPASIDGLILRMDASDLNGDGVIDDPAPETSSVLDWYFPTGNNWGLNDWFAYRSNHQNGLGIADWATLWLQKIENGQSGFQTILMAYDENALSWEGTAPMQGLSGNIPRHSDASQIYSNNAPATTLNGSTYLNGELVDPLTTANPMGFCVLGSAFTNQSNANIFYTDTHWEGKIGEMLFYDNALTDTQMRGVSEFLRQKWISTAELESPKTVVNWEGINHTLDEENSDNKLTIYPNPAGETVFLQSELTGLLQVQIFELQGKHLSTQLLSASDRVVNVSRLQAGIYYIEIIGNKGERATQRFVKM
jgi:hypothetical protein